MRYENVNKIVNGILLKQGKNCTFKVDFCALTHGKIKHVFAV